MRARCGVLHELRLIEDHACPLDLSEAFGVQAQDGVTRDDDISGGDSIRHRRSALRGSGAQDVDGEVGSEPRGLVLPGGQDRSGGDHEERPSLTGFARVRDQRQHLQGLAQAHVVGEDAAEAVLPEKGQPVESGALVGAEFGAKSGRRGRLGHGIGVAESLGRRAPRHRGKGLIRDILEI